MAAFAIFPTELGWFGLSGSDGQVECVTIGHASAIAARKALKRDWNGWSGHVEETDWHPELVARLTAYAAGQRVEFLDILIRLPRQTDFQRHVNQVVARIPFGETMTYGQVARHAGFPRAARAVGRVMARNKVPLIIPCHRVLGVGNQLTGFSAPQGIRLKRRLLDLEQHSIGR